VFNLSDCFSVQTEESGVSVMIGFSQCSNALAFLLAI